MGWSFKHMGFRDPVRAAAKKSIDTAREHTRGSVCDAVSTALDSLLAAFPADKGVSVDTTGHIDPNGGGTATIAIQSIELCD